MTTETKELTIDLQAVYADLFPYRDPQSMKISDDVLALGIWWRRQLGEKIVRCPVRHAEGSSSGPTARPTRKGKS